jgi:uncharacterized protein (DUF2062 family)
MLGAISVAVGICVGSGVLVLVGVSVAVGAVLQAVRRSNVRMVMRFRFILNPLVFGLLKLYLRGGCFFTQAVGVKTHFMQADG